VAASRALHRTFRVTVALKGLDGLLEVAGGVALAFVAPTTINHLVRALTAHELAEDPGDFVARHLLHSATQLSRGATVYGALYLLIHGLAKVGLVAAVLRDKLWAYPWMVALLVAFIGYQAYRLTYRPSLGLAGLTLFDGFVVWLTWLEYSAKRRVSSAPVS